MKLFIPLLFSLIAYFGYDYYQFQNADDSPLKTIQAEIDRQTKDISEQNRKLSDQRNFLKNLDQKRNEIKNLSNELNSMKETLQESFDEPAFIKLLVTEAKNVGLMITGLKPLQSVKSAYTIEKPFEIKYEGFYVQLLNFFDRLSKVKSIIKVDEFSIAPKNLSKDTNSKYVDLGGSIIVKAYSYLGTEEDRMSSDPLLQSSSVNQSQTGVNK